MSVKRPLLIVAANFVVLAALLEIAGLAVYYWQHGWLFYATPYRQQYAQEEAGRGDELTLAGLHPYFGPTHRPGIPFDIPEHLRRSADQPHHATNNFGFVSPYNYPVSRGSARQFFVGIFGGSVANWFCEVGAPRLLQEMARQPAFADRELVPICLAHEGYKQPQQALLLSYFLSLGQPFDLVISIDGFNDVALGHLNDRRGWDVTMPSVMHLDPLLNVINAATLTPEKLELLADISRRRQSLARLADRINGTRLASVYVAAEAYYGWSRARYQERLVAFQQAPSQPADQSVLHVTPPVRVRRGDDPYVDAARNWAASALLMHDLLAARGVRFIAILQPNQYATMRRFSAAEAAVALSEQSPFREGATRGYPVLQSVLAETRRARPDVTLIDGTGIFDAVTAPVYMDNCCHYTLAGNDALADVLARAVRAAPLPGR
jgi:hypothetical protein